MIVQIACDCLRRTSSPLGQDKCNLHILALYEWAWLDCYIMGKINQIFG